MRIGILTLPLHTNYGGILQAYALQTVLERMGHEVVVLDRPFHRKSLSFRKKITYYPKRIIKKYILYRKNVRIFQEDYLEKVQPIVEQYTRKFITKNIHIQQVKQLILLSETDFDALIVGSDQIWRPNPHQNIYDAFLEFTKTWNIKRIAYAASFGTDEWEFSKEQTIKCKELVHFFDCVSVREQSGVKLCAEYFNINATHVLDPTMLLNKEDYIKLFNSQEQKNKEHFLLVYILDITPEKLSLIDIIAKEKKLIPKYVNSKVEDLRAKLEDRIQPPVENWLKAFNDTDFVITDSFHACVFSIIFNKPFLVYGNKSRGLARFDSLLSLFNLSDRYISSINDYKSLSDINFENVNKIRAVYREKSISFLTTNLAK